MVDEKLAAVAERLASRLTGEWSEKLVRAMAEEFGPVLEAEIRQAGDAAAAEAAAEARRTAAQSATEIRRARETAVAGLAAALVRVLRGSTQAEILSALLDASQSFAGSVGLLVLRGTALVGWQSRGLHDPQSFSRLAIPANDRTMATLAQERRPIAAPAELLGDAFTDAGALSAYLLPLVIRERMAAVLCVESPRPADGSTADEDEVPVAMIEEARAASILPVEIEVIQALTLAACQTVELGTLRKPVTAASETPAPRKQKAAKAAAAVVPPSAVEPEPVPAPAPLERSGSFVKYPDFAPSNPGAAAPPEEVAPPSVATPPVPEPIAAPPPSLAAAAVAPPPPAQAPPASKVADGEDHVRAKRFAKLLVEEIQLYNQAKVAEGRAHHDLYDRLHGDIEKSRAAYLKRYGAIIREPDYFTEALVRILAANNPALLGAGFQG